MIDAIVRLTHAQVGDVVRGSMVGGEAQTLACVAAAMTIRDEASFANLMSVGVEMAGFTQLKSSEVSELKAIDQFRGDDAFVEKFGIGRWFAPASHGITDFRIDEIADVNELLRSSVDGSTPDEVTRMQTASLFGENGSQVVSFLVAVADMDDADWHEVRNLAKGEFYHSASLSNSELNALSVLMRRGSDYRLIGLLQYWARYLGFRGSFNAAYGIVVSDVPTKAALEWDVAWPAWAADLTRRSALEVYAGLSSHDKGDNAIDYFRPIFRGGL